MIGKTLAALTLLAASCAVGPTFKAPPAPVTETWRVAGNPHLATATAADSQWWRAFNDPALVAARRPLLPAEPAPADRGDQDRRGPRPARRGDRQAVPPVPGRVRERDGGGVEPERAQPRFHRPQLRRLPARVRRGLGARLLGQIPERRRSGDRRAARLGGRLLRRPRVADRGGRADLRRDPYLRGADRPGRAERQAPGGRARDRGGPVQGRRDLGARSDPGDDAAREHARLDSTAQSRARAGTQRSRHAARSANGHRPGAAHRGQGDPERAREGRDWCAGGDPAPAAGHPQRRAAGRRPVRANRRRQGRALS